MRRPGSTLILAAVAAALFAAPATAAAQPAPNSPAQRAQPAAQPAPQPAQPAPNSPAQPAQPAPNSPAPAAQPAPPARGVPAADAKAAYNRAFNALAAGDFTAAIAGFDRVALTSSDPNTRAAARELARMARTLSQRGVVFTTAAPGAGAPRVVAEEDQPNAGRVGFIVTTTLAGVYSGFTLLSILDVTSFQGGVLLVTGTTGAAFLASLYGSRGRTITTGMSEAYSLGLAVGAGNGLLLADPLGASTANEVLSMGLGGMVAGGASALLVASRSRPTPAQVSFTGTLSMLGVATTGLGLGIVQPTNLDGSTLSLLLTGGLDIGAAVGIGFSRHLTWSKSRSRLVGLGAFLGGLAGAAGAAIITGTPSTTDQGRLLSATTLGGMWAGFGLAVHLTDGMAPDFRYRSGGGAAASATLAPLAIPGGAGAAIAGTF